MGDHGRVLTVYGDGLAISAGFSGLSLIIVVDVRRLIAGRPPRGEGDVEMHFGGAFRDNYAGLGAQQNAELDGHLIGRHCPQPTDYGANGRLDLIQR